MKPSPKPQKIATRRPRRASIHDAIQALVAAGVDPSRIVYNRRDDVVFVKGQDSATVSAHGSKTQWPTSE